MLITTRDEAIVRASGALPHVLEELTEPAARAFLAEAVGLAERDLPPAAADVIRECGRLPLALALAGATLADGPQDASLWRDVVEALASADHDQLRAEFDYPYAHPLAAIQASVDFLPAADRSAYLQLAIFPDGVRSAATCCLTSPGSAASLPRATCLPCSPTPRCVRTTPRSSASAEHFACRLTSWFAISVSSQLSCLAGWRATMGAGSLDL